MSYEIGEPFPDRGFMEPSDEPGFGVALNEGLL